MPDNTITTVSDEALLRIFKTIQWSKMHPTANEDMNDFVEMSYDEAVAEIERRGLSVPEYQWE